MSRIYAKNVSWSVDALFFDDDYGHYMVRRDHIGLARWSLEAPDEGAVISVGGDHICLPQLPQRFADWLSGRAAS